MEQTVLPSLGTIAFPINIVSIIAQAIPKCIILISLKYLFDLSILAFKFASISSSGHGLKLVAIIDI